MKFIAHENQSLKDHLEGVAELGKKNASKLGCDDYGELLGLLHDLGKYSNFFQKYIRSATDNPNPDDDEEFVDARGLKGKIDHSTAGAQFVWRQWGSGSEHERLLAQILSLCLVSHHSGLIDCLSNTAQSGTVDIFSKRMNKAYEKTFYNEVFEKAEIMDRVKSLINKPDFIKPMDNIITNIEEKNPEKDLCLLQKGLLVRILFSCLIDADRQDSADSEKPKTAHVRQNGVYIEWNELIERLENHLKNNLNLSYTAIDPIRQNVSEYCLAASRKPKGIFTLTVPTGGGKTLASLRFGVHHAQEHKLDHIFYIIPFTSIIDQNAQVAREIMEINKKDKGCIILEHHSNIGSEKQSWKEKLLTENWDAPIIFTTMVQFLETLFGGGTRGARRMHQLANSLIIFDEIQTLPINCVHLFCNAVNFFVNHCGSSVVLCTATQPLLGEVDIHKGRLELSKDNEIVPDVRKLFKDLKRVNVLDCRKNGGWTDIEVADLAEKCVRENGSCLVVVNLKKSARSLYKELKARNSAKCFHLTTGMCPAHRKRVFNKIKKRLPSKLPTICISTSLIECGVDISFGTAIRYIAGLDSIAQTGGRCNRHNELNTGIVYVINPADEELSTLPDINTGRQKTEQVLDDYNEDPEVYQNDPIGPDLINWYYQNYFFKQKKIMDYPVSRKNAGRDDTILNLLSSNIFNVSNLKNVSDSLPLPQAFMTAGDLFKSIDAPTESVIVPYGKKGDDIIAQLSAAFDVEKQYGLLRKAQQYSINIYPNDLNALKKENAITKVQEDTEIYYVKKTYYSDEFGISLEALGKEGLLHV